jgi:excisionase family DNA binding protein
MTSYLTIIEAMAALKVCRNTLNKHIKSGRLRVCRVGRIVRIKAEDLQRFIEGRPGRPAKKK